MSLGGGGGGGGGGGSDVVAALPLLCIIVDANQRTENRVCL